MIALIGVRTGDVFYEKKACLPDWVSPSCYFDAIPQSNATGESESDFPHRPVQEPSMRSCDLGHHWPNEEDVMAKNNWGQLFLLVFIVDQLRLHTTD